MRDELISFSQSASRLSKPSFYNSSTKTQAVAERFLLSKREDILEKLKFIEKVVSYIILVKVNSLHLELLT